MSLSFLIWNGSPEIFTSGWLSLRWYGLLFALGFLLSQQILYYMFKKERMPQSDVDTLTIYMVIATILGARLGHIIFYQPDILWKDPLGVLLPFQFTPEFKFTGLQGLASHGAAFGILFALWLYSNYLIFWSKESGEETIAKDKISGKPDTQIVDGNSAIRHKIKKGFNFIKRIKPGQNYIQTLDRIVILVTLTGALIRLGNFFNSEIIGLPTDGPTGIVFMNQVNEMFTKSKGSPVDFLEVKKNLEAADGVNGRKPINIYVFFKPGTPQMVADNFIQQQGKSYLVYDTEFIDEPSGTPINYNLIEDKDGIWVGKIQTMGISRHPSQLYESISCFLFFLVLLWLWTKGKVQSNPGLIFGIFMIVLWSLRFLYEFIKEPQVEFENSLPINMGQILSIPLIIVGVIILVRAMKRKA